MSKPLVLSLDLTPEQIEAIVQSGWVEEAIKQVVKEILLEHLEMLAKLVEESLVKN